MRLKTATILVIVLAIFALGNIAQAGLGISPSDWIEKNALRGSRIEKTFTLSRSNPDEDLYFKAAIEGEIKDWIKIEKGLDFVMPKGEQQFPVKVIIDVPQDAEYRNYQAEIRLKSESKSKETSGMGSSVLLNALIRINLIVSQKQVLDYEILQITIPKQEEGNPINVLLKIWNRGNVEAKPTRLTIDFFDKYNQAKIDSKDLTDFSNIKAVAAFSEGEIKLEIPLQLGIEQYWAKVKVYQDEKVLKSEEITFDVVEKGSLSKKDFNQTTPTTNATSKSSKINLSYILISIGIIVLVAGVGFGIRQLQKSGLKLEIKVKKKKGAKNSKK